MDVIGDYLVFQKVPGACVSVESRPRRVTCPRPVIQ